jgi:hypothetical protein
VTGVDGGGPSAREWQLFGVGTGLVWVHVVDHLVAEPRLGWSLAPVTLLFEAATALAVLTVVVAVVYGRLAWWPRRAIALSVGAMWLVASFVHHVVLMLVRGPEPTDYTGVSATIGGLLIVVAGLAARAQAGGSVHAARSASAPPSSRGTR